MRHLLYIILVLGLVVAGCAGPKALGPSIDDPARRASLLKACEGSDVTWAVFRTVVHWSGRALSLTEIVKRHSDGGYSVVGIADVGKTLYAARVAADYSGEIISKSLPFSDRWLLEGFVSELLVPWTAPDGTSDLHELADGTYALVQNDDRLRHVYLFDDSGQWVEYWLLLGARLRFKVSMEWGEGAVPKTMRIENSQRHYRVVRENVSTQ